MDRTKIAATGGLIALGLTFAAAKLSLDTSTVEAASRPAASALNTSSLFGNKYLSVPKFPHALTKI